MKIEIPTMSASRWKTLMLIAALVTVLRILMQPLIPESESVLEPSVIVQAGLIIPAFAIYAFVVYLALCFSFALIEARLPWGRMAKGMVFALCIGAIWMAYMFEPVPLGEGVPLVELLAYPLADGASVIVLGLLLGRFASSEKVAGRKAGLKGNIILLTLPTVLLVIRLFEYNVLEIYSSYEGRTLDTVLWVIVTGMIISISYTVLREGVPSSGPWGRALAFGLFFFGIPVLLMNFFVALALVIVWTDLALRLTLDIAAVIIAVHISEVYHEVTGDPGPASDGASP